MNRTAATVALGFVAVVSRLSAAPAVPITAAFSGSIAGVVRDNTGVPQMGASVLLFNRYEKLMERALTNERGLFGFEALPPDVYSVRVSLASFVPAMKHKIAVEAGIQSLLFINMASVLSSVELVYAAPGQGALMSDEWKWTLKSSVASRPVLRFLPDIPVDPNKQSTSHVGSIFSDTLALVNLSAGDSDAAGSTSTESDLGTAFAVATSIFGRNQIQLSGNVGYAAHTGLPATGFRTSYSRDGMGPEISITMRQVYLPVRGAIGNVNGQVDGYPALRTMSVSTFDHIQITKAARLEYGISLDSVSYLDHLNQASPFGRLTYDLGSLGTVEFAYSSGVPPQELVATPGNATELQLQQDLNALALMPQISMRDGHAKVQRTQDFEIGYEKRAGTRTYNLSAFHEIVSNGALIASGSADALDAGDIIPDLSSRSSVFNVGEYQRSGYSASVTQSFGERLQGGAAVGRDGVLTLDSSDAPLATGDDLRAHLTNGERLWASLRVSTTLPHTGTELTASYRWMDGGAISPSHFSETQMMLPQAGWNMRIRQPLPNFGGWPGRFEATAELRNLLAQEYLPLTAADGSRILLVQSPRAVRGGLSFIF